MGISQPTKTKHNRFIQDNQKMWTRLEYLIANFSSLDHDELNEFGHTYRQVSSHLAFAQTYYKDHEMNHYLNQLVIRAHNLLYSPTKKRYSRKLYQFFFHRFPELVYRRSSFFLAALALFLFGTLLAFTLTYIDKNFATLFFPESMIHEGNFDETKEQWNYAIVSSEIMTNNIIVAFMCFAGGVLFGSLTTWYLFMNGMLLGSLASLYHQADSAYQFWAYIWPHGVLELTAIFIAGAAGLSLGYKMLVPGELTRKHAIIQEGIISIKMMLGVIPLFIVAALIEGFFTPLPLPHWSKYFVALITGVILVIYLGRPFFKYGVKRA
ncbi:stage II sporulation protein M [Hazenella sp. IB182357]|uniref:Stage II sporulation protein M n=1 Tax=Polycladospora coralii TaxID=2771432 RepID=A0A926N7L7_9BACL|nr:stage II sporulation protein M [Polycladospora coralii]MBD1371511.1 stage II sporulation protein M [Polycladospora coralii]